MAQLMPLPLIVSCFSKLQIGFTVLVLAHPGSRGQSVVKRACVCVNRTATTNLLCDFLHRLNAGAVEIVAVLAGLDEHVVLDVVFHLVTSDEVIVTSANLVLTWRTRRV